MTFIIPQYSHAQLEEQIAADFPLEDREEVRKLVTPFFKTDSRIPRDILQLSTGDRELVAYYAEVAGIDFRDILLWAARERGRIRVPARPWWKFWQQC